ncbi:unnamed protein product [Citrullus colocynthis]|uniref:Transmembrane protein n=1 Tax=Citrullus colocynthis TaxID=252529 RepID=A0ABP0XND9_9ROSI
MANTKMIFSSSSLYLVLFFTISLSLLLSSATTSVRSTPEITLPSSMHIVYTSEMPNDENPDAFNLQILTSVLGRFVFLDKLFKEIVITICIQCGHHNNVDSKMCMRLITI